MEGSTPPAERPDALPEDPHAGEYDGGAAGADAGAEVAARRSGPQLSDAQQRTYWRANVRLLALLLCVWFVASLGLGILLVEPLNAWRLGGFPLGFWFAHQGSIYVFVVLIFVYASCMDRIERRLRESSSR